MWGTRMNRVWLVMGATGEYSDRQEWPVRAYLDKSVAEREVVRLTDEARALFADVGYGWEPHQRKAVQGHGKKVGDPGFSMDYTGTSYFYYEAELV